MRFYCPINFATFSSTKISGIRNVPKSFLWLYSSYTSSLKISIPAPSGSSILNSLCSLYCPLLQNFSLTYSLSNPGYTFGITIPWKPFPYLTVTSIYGLLCLRHIYILSFLIVSIIFCLLILLIEYLIIMPITTATNITATAIDL